MIAAVGILVSLGSCSNGSRAKGVLPVVIAVTIPITGDAASYGEIQKRGIAMALSEVNTDPAHPVLRIVYKDTQLNPKEAVNALQQSLMQDGAQVVFSISTGEVMAQAPICNEKHVILLSPLASGDDITAAGRYVYRVSPTDSFQGKVMAEKVLGLGVKRLAILNVNDSFGVGLAGAFRRDIERGGGMIVSSEACDPTQTDLRTHLTKIRSAKPEGLFIVVHPGQAVAVLKQIRQLGIQARLFGADTFSNRDVYTAAKAYAQGVVFSLPAMPDSPGFKKFSLAYTKAYKSPPDINAAAAYDAVMLVARAVKAGARTGEDLRTMFDKRESYEGASGTVRWDENGDVVSKKYAVYVIHGYGYRPL
jgi:branched-chain amino acid transport system substrate-binding protein